MRTDSVNLAQEAIARNSSIYCERYGKENLPEEAACISKLKRKMLKKHMKLFVQPRVYSIPEQIKEHFNPEQYKLYDLIWKRTVACQMIHATIDTVAVDLAVAKTIIFRANGSTIADPGFIAVYQEGIDDAKR